MVIFNDALWERVRKRESDLESIEDNNPRFKELKMSETNDITTTLLGLIKRFKTMAEERAKTLPYGINLIETLGGAYETQNSKIIAAIIHYRSPSGRFEILESLIDYIQSRFNVFHEIKVEHPKIYTEHRHIDVYVCEPHKYAIIMENKSNGAGDQDKQLSRYIETAISEHFDKEKIYVLYLPPQAGKDPEEQSWGVHKDAFEARYVKLSWRDDILPWMKEKVLPNVRHKDIPLSSALEQYIDYWEGQFGLRGFESEGKMKMKLAVIEGLALGSEQDDGRALEAIREAYENAKTLTETLEILANEKKCKIELRFWNDLICDLKFRGYNNIEPINLTESGILKNYLEKKSYYVGISIRFYANGRPFVFECWSQVNGYYGFKFMDETGKDEQISRPSELSEQSQRIEQIVKEVLPGCNPWPAWYGCISVPDFDFRNMLYKTVVEKMGTSDKCKEISQQWAVRFDGYIRTFQIHLEDKFSGHHPADQQP